MTELSTPHDGQHTLEACGVNEIWLTPDKNHGVTPAMVVARHEVDAEDRKLLGRMNLRWAATLTRRDGGGTICWVLRPRRGFVVRSRWSEPDGGTSEETIRVGEMKIIRSGSNLNFNEIHHVVFDSSVPALRGPLLPPDGSMAKPGRAVASAGGDARSALVESSGAARIDSSRANSPLSVASESDASVGAAKEGIPGDMPDNAWGFDSEPDWSCPRCTLINTGCYLQCEACGCLQPSERPLRPAVFPPKSYMKDQAKQWATSEMNPGTSVSKVKRKRTPGIGNPCRGEGNAAQSAFAASAVRPASPCGRVPAASALISKSSGGASSCGVPDVKTAALKGKGGATDRGRDAVVPLSRASPAEATKMLVLGNKSGTQPTAVASADHQNPLRASKLPARKSAKSKSPALAEHRRSTPAAKTAALRRSDSPRGDRELGRGGAAVPRSRATSPGPGATETGATPPAKSDIRPAAAEATGVAAERQIPAWLSSMIRAGKPPASSEGVPEDGSGKEASAGVEGGGDGKGDSEADGGGSGKTEIENNGSLSGIDTEPELQGQEQNDKEVEHDDSWGVDDDFASDISLDYK